MSFAAISAMFPRLARSKFSLVVLALTAMLLPLAERSSAQTFSNGSNTINVSGTYGFSKSSTVSVSGISGTVTAISVTLTNLNVTGSNGGGVNSLSMVLKPPSGTAFDLLGGPCDSGNATFTLADSGDTGSDNTDGMLSFVTCPSSFSGTYLPADYFANYQTEVFNAGGSGGPTTFNTAGVGNTTCEGLESGLTCGNDNFSTAFGLPTAGTNFNGTWTLYIANQDNTGEFTPSGSLGLWSITFTTSAAAATTTSLSTSNPGTSTSVFTDGDVHGDATSGTPVTFTATITPNPGAGTVTFYDSTGTTAGAGTQLGSPVAVNGSGQAQDVVTFTAAQEGTRTISAVYNGTSSYTSSTSSLLNELTVNHAYNPSGTTYCNGPVTIENNSGGGAGGTGGYPYPSQLVLSGLTGTIESVTVSLNGLQAEEPRDLGFLLQAPSSGNAFEFMSWVDGQGGSANDPATLTDLDLTLADTGSGNLRNNSPDTAGAVDCSSGPCLPTDEYPEFGPLDNDTFPSPAPAGIGRAYSAGSTTFASEFGGGGANGAWQLYLNNWGAENPSNNGSLPYGQLNEWCLNFTMQSNAHPTTTSASGSPNPASITSGTTASVTLTANVSVTDGSGDPVNAGTVTFVDGSTTLGTSTVSSSGVAALTTSLTEGTHQIVASYSGTNSGTEFGISSATFDERVDTASVIPASGTGAGPYAFCNTGAITAPGGNYDYGTASPYPSNIFVSNLPGTVQAATVTLKNFSTHDQGDLMSLLVGPGGNNLDFFSLTGSDIAAGPMNLTFADGGAGIGGSLTGSGTFAPASDNTSITYPQCPQNATDCASENVGPPLASNPFTPTAKAAPAGAGTLASVFSGSNGNGTWSLYLDDGGPTGDGEITTVGSGWCVNLTENQPAVTPSLPSTSTFSQGQAGSFPLTIANNGPGPTGDATGTNPMTVTDTLNAAFAYRSYSGSGWSCSAVAQTVTCTNDSAISDGNSYPTLTIGVNVSPTASTSGTIANSVTVIGAGVSSTNSNTDQVTILPAPLLSVTKTHTGTFTQGSTAEWEITVNNTVATSVTTGTVNLSDTLPSGYTVNSFGSTSPSWSCSGATTVSCSSTQTVSGGSSFPVIQVIVNVPATSPVSVTNTASAWGGGDLQHTNSGNAATGSDSNVTVVQVPASLSVSSGGTQSTTVSTAFAAALSVTVEDANSVPIQGASVTFTAPSSGASGTFSNSSTTITETTNSSGIANAGAFTANSNPGAYSVTASVSGLGSTATFSLTNTQPPAFTSASSTTFLVNSPGSFTVTTSAGFPGPATLAVSNIQNAIPGVTVPASGTGMIAISGTPTATGIETFTITATNGAGLTATQNFTLTALIPQVQITTAANPAGGGTVTPPSGNLYNVGTVVSLQATPATGYTFLNWTSSPDAVASATSASTTILMNAAETATANFTPTLVVNTAVDDAGHAGNCSAQATPGVNTIDAACSLRDALLFAASAGSGSITFDSTAFSAPQSIPLSNGTLMIPSNTTITGPTTGSGATLKNLVTVNGNAASTDFTVNSGVTGASLSGLTITNGSSANGGGINNSGTLTVSGSTISGNAAPAAGGNAQGGGVFNSGTLTLSESTVSGNSATASGGEAGGGGIYNQGTLTLNGSTVSGNTATAGGNGGGAGIVQNGGTLNANNSTISANTADGAAGGVYINGGTVNLANTIVSGNSAPASPDLLNGGGTLNDNGGNQVGAGGLSLAPLGNYGGPTRTMLPLPGNLALCGGTSANATAAGITADQRGYGFDPNCPPNTVDAGAVQTNYGLAFTTEPPSSANAGVALSPAPVVGLTENGAAVTAATSSITMTDSAALLGGTDSASLSSGSATFGNLVLTSAASSDTLTATLSLNPSLVPPLNLTAVASTSITVIGPQTINFPAITTEQFAVTTLNLSATASSGLTINFASTTPAVCTVSSATASLLAEGICTIQATQPGDSTYTAAPMVQQKFLVHLAPQTISFTPITGPLYALSSLPLSATASSGLTVTFASLTPSVCSVSAATASLLTKGTCVIHALQAGSNVYSAAPQVSQDVRVQLNSQTISFPAITGYEVAATTISLPATASSGRTVNFASTTPAVCTVSSATTSLLMQGTCNIQATQPGDGETYAAATLVTRSFGVHLAPQTISFTPIANPQYVLSSVPLAATASSRLAVSFASLTPSACTVSGTTASMLTVGTCVIHAIQAGNNVYSVAPQVSQDIPLRINPQTITFPAITATQYAASTLPLSATASSGLPVSLASTTPAVCTVSSGVASLLMQGTCILRATQAGNADYSAAPVAQQSFLVHLVPQTISFPAIPNQVVGAHVTLSATASSGLTVSFSSATTSVCSVAGITATMLTPGACVIHATQGGSNVYTVAPLVSRDLTVKAH